MDGGAEAEAESLGASVDGSLLSCWWPFAEVADVSAVLSFLQLDPNVRISRRGWAIFIGIQRGNSNRDPT